MQPHVLVCIYCCLDASFMSSLVDLNHRLLPSLSPPPSQGMVLACKFVACMVSAFFENCVRHGGGKASLKAGVS